MRLLGNWPLARSDRHATAMLYDGPGCRLVAFTLTAGQVVPVHTSTSSVVISLFEGSGVFTGGAGEKMLGAGESLCYDANEPHGMTAGANGLRFLATITPSPQHG